MAAALPLAVEAGPRRVADVSKQLETLGAHPSGMVAAGGRVFFSGEDRVHGRELWMTDGTEAGTKLVNDLRVGQAGSHPAMLRAVGDRVFFFADDGEHGVELWSTDGEVTVIAGDQRPGGINFSPRQAVAAGGLLYFAEGPNPGPSDFMGYGLWRSDGTSDGTFPLNLRDPDTFLLPFGRADLLTELGGGLFFTNHGRELWQSPGTLAETVRLADLGDGAQIISMLAIENSLWFTLHRSDPSLFQVAGGRLFFAANDGIHGDELWRSDTGGTALVRDIRPGTGT